MTNERGSVTVVTAALILVVLVLTLGTADVAKVVVARTHARWAADAAALAAAQDLALGGEDPGAPAAEYANRNGAQLMSCACPAGGTEAVVEVRLRVGGLFLASDGGWASARARAIVDWPGPGGASVGRGIPLP